MGKLSGLDRAGVKPEARLVDDRKLWSDMTEGFSKRFGVVPKPTGLLRNEAPPKMRLALVRLLSDNNFEIVAAAEALFKAERKVPVCYLTESSLRRNPDWSLVELELRAEAKWYEVFDFIEIICGQPGSCEIERKINELLVDFDIGWKVLNGRIETRGDELFENTVQTARTTLDRAGRVTARAELEEAMASLSRRPIPDSRGAVTRAVGALEALARDITKEPTATLGQLIKQLDLPQPLDIAAAKLWGYASDKARHVTEGVKPERPEAAFVVQVCAAFIFYLSDDK